MTRGRSRPFVLIAAPFAVVALLFVLPLTTMVRQSMADGLAHYLRFFGDPYYLSALGVTMGTALLVTAITGVVSYPVALTYWQASPGWRPVLVVLLLSPFYANVVVKVFGWMVLLPSALRDSYTAIVVIDVHRSVPFMVLLLAAALARIEPELLESARTCGASPLRVFRTVIFPLSLPGAIGGGLLVFSLTLASFVVPLLAGGPMGGRFLPVLMYQQITIAQNWGFGAAIGVILLVAAMVAVAAGNWMMARSRVGRVASEVVRG